VRSSLATALPDGRALDYTRLRIMGIINATPDSFFSGSRAHGAEAAAEAAKRMAAEGADILDIGGESTRPGAEEVSAEEEKRRAAEAVSAIRQACPDILISVDTWRAATAAEAIARGADMVNDISALRFDPGLADVVRKADVPVILMHTAGTPRDMQQKASYTDVVREVLAHLAERVEYAVGAGIRRDRIIIDPGIGFGKLREHNIELLRRIDEFSALGLPVLVGASRKTFIGQTLGAGTPLPPEERLEGTLAVTAHCAAHKVQIVRVHDVRSNIRAARMTEALS